MKRSLVENALRRLVPRVPDHERDAILDHAEDSVGLSKASPETAAWLSMIAYVRHTLTDYDALLDEGYDREAARHFVLADMNEILRGWGSKRLVDGSEG